MKFIQYIPAIVLIWINLVSVANQSPATDSLLVIFKNEQNMDQRDAILDRLDSITQPMNRDTVLNLWKSLAHYCMDKEYNKNAGFCYYILARELRKTGAYFESYETYLKSKEFFEIAADRYGIARVHNGIGTLFKYLDRPNQSAEHYLKSAALYHALNDTVWEGSVYLNLGGMWEEQDSLNLAKFYLQKSEKMLEAQHHYNLLNCYINLAIVFDKESKIDTAYYYLTESYKLAMSKGDLRDKFNGSLYLGNFHLEQNNIAGAEPFLLEAKNIVENTDSKNTLSINDLADFSEIISRYFALTGDSAKAYSYLKNSIDFEAKNKIENARLEYNRLEFNLAEQEAMRKQKSRETVIAVAAAILLLTLILLLSIYRSYKHKLKANRLLTEMDELKTRMFSDISHELRTPLTMIIAPLEQMLSEEAAKNPSRKQIKLMRKNANAILNLVNQILDLSKIDAKSMKLELSESDIVSFIRAHFASFASMASHKHISFSSYTPPDKKIRLYDASKLEKIINNLVSNALKYTPEGGQVFCFASFPKENRLEMVIQDTGAGISAEELPKIFDRFHRVKGTSTSSPIGTGIGLSLTKELVELMYGQITVDSIIGEGTKFKVVLPLGNEHLKKDEYVMLGEYRPSETTIENEEESVEQCKETLSKTESETAAEILIVEDHPEISDFIAENLRSCYKIETAPNGKIGFNKATEDIPDLIISDVMMPEMNGIEMSKKLKKDERTSHIPIILLTAKSSQADKIEGLETGVEAFLPKPFSMKELALRVNKLIEQRRKLRERFTKNLQLEPREIAVTSADEKFLDRVMQIIEKEMSNAEFEVSQLQDELLMSRTQLFRKIKALTNQSPGEFIRTIRLKRAARLMEQKFGNIAQITFEVGFNNPSYFAKCFKELFGQLPSEYMKK